MQTGTPIRARCEDPADWIDGGGTIDIVLEIGEFAIAIENKPFAAEQPNQLQRYCQHLSRKYKNYFCMVFLGGRTAEPESISPSERRQLEESGRFKVMRYDRELLGWLQLCEEKAKPQKVRSILADLRSFVRSEFGPIKRDE